MGLKIEFPWTTFTIDQPTKKLVSYNGIRI